MAIHGENVPSTLGMQAPNALSTVGRSVRKVGPVIPLKCQYSVWQTASHIRKELVRFPKQVATWTPYLGAFANGVVVDLEVAGTDPVSLKPHTAPFMT